MTAKIPNETMSRFKVAKQFLAMAEDLDPRACFPGCRILDFGCGDGGTVAFLLSVGYDAHGCDVPEAIRSVGDEYLSHLKIDAYKTRCLPVGMVPYKIPFPDGYFDVVISNQVFEHVMGYPEVIAELARVSKNSGIGVHVFPSRWKIIESHVFVPLSSVFRGWWYLYAWSLIGVRNSYQAGMSSRDVASNNREYLNSRTNYLSWRGIEAEFLRSFEGFAPFEQVFVRRHVGKLGGLLRVLRYLPGFRFLFRHFHSRTVFVHQPKSAVPKSAVPHV